MEALGDSIPHSEKKEIQNLVSLNLPPITSARVLCTMLGVSAGFIRSFYYHPDNHYRTFKIFKGNKVRRIDAPRVAIKIIQKWLSIQLSNTYKVPNNVFGFVSGRSHIDAARHHLGANWVYSVDIKDFFQTTSQQTISINLRRLGFSENGSNLISMLCCYKGFLAQGAPSSPILSNICFEALDEKLVILAASLNVRLSRYADDIVFSGNESFPESLSSSVSTLFSHSEWSLAEDKTTFSQLPNRLKVHGLLVHGEQVRLTKGYRNRIRAYRHLISKKAIKSEDVAMVKGHLSYSNYVETL